jgi:hypothetical protein
MRASCRCLRIADIARTDASTEGSSRLRLHVLPGCHRSPGGVGWILVSGVRREEDEASLPPIECSAARMDTVRSVGDGEWDAPGWQSETIARIRCSPMWGTSRTRELPQTRGDREDRSPAPPSRAKRRSHLPLALERRERSPGSRAHRWSRRRRTVLRGRRSKRDVASQERTQAGPVGGPGGPRSLNSQPLGQEVGRAASRARARRVSARLPRGATTRRPRARRARCARGAPGRRDRGVPARS